MGRVAAGQDRAYLQRMEGPRSAQGSGARGRAERSSWLSLEGAPGLEEPRVSQVRTEGFGQSKQGPGLQ